MAMTVVSISLSGDALGSLGKVQAYLELSGRSEAVRASIKMAEAEIREMEGLNGHVEGVLVIVHSTHDDQWMSLIQHKYEKNIRTQLHSHLQNRKCLEVMILSSEASELQKMLKEIHGIGKADYLKFVRGQ